MKRKTFNNVVEARIKARTGEIVVGKVYFLSSWYDRDGAFVRVLSKSKKKNSCGWPSTVEYEVIECVGGGESSFHQRYYAKGKTGTCNATNLYERRRDARVGKVLGKGD